MEQELFFRVAVATVFLATFAISARFRYQARKMGGTIPRAREGKSILILRLIAAALLYLPLLAHMINPASMEWASIPVPAWLRWAAVAASLSLLPALVWLFASIGRNISETVLTKRSHRLITHGPYRWIRHPLYSVATGIFIALGVAAANAFIVLVAVLAIMAVLVAIIPREEAQLIAKFGDDYRSYRERTGRLLPRLLRR